MGPEAASQVSFNSSANVIGSIGIAAAIQETPLGLQPRADHSQEDSIWDYLVSEAAMLASPGTLKISDSSDDSGYEFEIPHSGHESDSEFD